MTREEDGGSRSREFPATQPSRKWQVSSSLGDPVSREKDRTWWGWHLTSSSDTHVCEQVHTPTYLCVHIPHTLSIYAPQDQGWSSVTESTLALAMREPRGQEITHQKECSWAFLQHVFIWFSLSLENFLIIVLLTVRTFIFLLNQLTTHLLITQ